MALVRVLKCSLSSSKTSAKSTATTMACEEKSEYHHSRSGGLLCTDSSCCPQRVYKSHSRPLVIGLQWAGGRGCCPGWCHKVEVT